MNAGKLLAIGAAITVTLAVGTSIWLDPPADNRTRAMDDERMRRLALIKTAVDNYFARHQALPRDLEALNAETNELLRASWRDPKTGGPFEYEITAEKNYRLCANFERSSSRRYTYYFPEHKVGRDCLEYNVK